MAVPKSSKNQLAAWNFISYLTDPTRLVLYYTKTGLSSPLINIKTDDFPAYQDNFATSWYNPDPAKVTDIFKTSANQALAGDNPQTVLEGAAAQITTLLGLLKK